MHRNLEALFGCLITLQFMVVVLHEWIDIPGWTHGRQVQAVIGRNQLLRATAINAVFPGLAVAFAIWFWGRPQPGFVGTYWMIYCGVTLLSAIAMWYIPYFFGADEKKKLEDWRMYAGTKYIFPVRGTIRVPTCCTSSFTCCSW